MVGLGVSFVLTRKLLCWCQLLERKVPGSRSLKLTFICKVEQEGQLKIAQELLVKLLSTLLKGGSKPFLVLLPSLHIHTDFPL